MNKYIICFFLLFCVMQITAQDIHFTHIFNPNILTNPGRTGLINGNQRIALSYRNQWTTAQSPYKTYFVAGDAVIGKPNKSNFGVGFYAFKDVSGDLNLANTLAMVSISTIIPTGEKSKISLGVQGGYGLHSLEKSEMKWDAQYVNGRYNSGANSGEVDNFSPFGYADINAGFVYSFNSGDPYNMGMGEGKKTNIELGLAIHHLLEPKFEYYQLEGSRLYRNYIAHFNGVFYVNNTNYALNPSLIYTKQGPYKELGIGFIVKYMLKEGSKYTSFSKKINLSAGGVYRYKDAFIPSVFFEYHKYSIGFNFGLNHSYLRKATKSFSGFEIMLRFINF